MITSRRLAGLLAIAAAIILLHQASDLGWMLPGVDFSTSAGRARQLIAMESRSPGFLAADVLLIWACLTAAAERSIRWLGAVHLLLGVLLILACPLFLLDAGKLASGFGGDQSSAFRVVVARTLLVFALLGTGALIAGRTLRRMVPAGSP